MIKINNKKSIAYEKKDLKRRPRLVAEQRFKNTVEERK